MKRHTASVALATLIGVLALYLAAPASAKPRTVTDLGTVPITGTIPNDGSFTGQLQVANFTTQAGQLAAVGTLTGTLTDALGNLIGTVTQAVTVPVAAAGSCQILHLTLGPLDLNLLGLMVHLNQVVLDITAQSGPGNLLGNLLCGVANLLNSNAPLSQIAALLNNLLALL
jgi:hypothetical protein